MTELWEDLKSKVHGLLGSWASISALGSFVLYLFGYLALRFHLTTLGIGTDLAVLDERYLFTGAKFLVYLAATIPIIVLLALVLAVVLTLPGWGVKWLYKRSSDGFKTFIKRIGDWIAEPRQVAMI